MSKVAAKYGVLRVHPNPEFKKFDGVKMFRPHWPYNDEVIVVEVSTECLFLRDVFGASLWVPVVSPSQSPNACMLAL